MVSNSLICVRYSPHVELLLEDVFFPFFYCRYNPLWVLAFSVILYLPFFSLHNLLHPLITILCISSSTSQIHLFLGFPLILLPIGFHSNIFYVFCFHHVIYPSYSSAIINLTMSAFSFSSFSSWFVLIPQYPSSFYTGSKIFLNILRSSILRHFSPIFVNVQTLEDVKVVKSILCFSLL
jgi:hypothetical protein